MTSSKNYVLSNIKQLIDINGEHVNFSVRFVISGDNDKTYQMAIVDQNALDRGPIEYKSVTGSTDGVVENKDGVFKNYYLALRADEAVKVTVDLKMQPLPDMPVREDDLVTVPDSAKKSGSVKFYIIIVAVLAGLGLLYFLINKKKADDMHINMMDSVIANDSVPMFSGFTSTLAGGGSPADSIDCVSVTSDLLNDINDL